jgi:hypothetical protein
VSSISFFVPPASASPNLRTPAATLRGSARETDIRSHGQQPPFSEGPILTRPETLSSAASTLSFAATARATQGPWAPWAVTTSMGREAVKGLGGGLAVPAVCEPASFDLDTKGHSMSAAFHPLRSTVPLPPYRRAI